MATQEIIRQHLHWATDETWQTGGATPPGKMSFTRMTVAQSFDGRDETYTKLYAADYAELVGQVDTIYEASASAYQSFSLTPCVATGEISKVAITARVRADLGESGWATAGGFFWDDAFGAPVYLTSEWQNVTWESATLPVGLPSPWRWDNINAYNNFGIALEVGCNCGGGEGQVSAYCSEFYVTVYSYGAEEYDYNEFVPANGEVVECLGADAVHFEVSATSSALVDVLVIETSMDKVNWHSAEDVGGVVVSGTVGGERLDQGPRIKSLYNSEGRGIPWKYARAWVGADARPSGLVCKAAVAPRGLSGIRQ